jgi:hypothetical protein
LLASSEIDDRNTRYLDRSDTFEDAKVESKSADGKEAVFSAAIRPLTFLFGTDNVGRDLMTRTLVAGTDIAVDRVARRLRRRLHRRRLRRRFRLPRRQDGRNHDAHRRCALLLAVPSSLSSCWSCSSGEISC